MMAKTLYEMAKVAAQHVNGGDFDGKDFYSDEHRQRWVEAMEKALLPAREPTLEMMIAGQDAGRKVRVTGVSGMTIDAQTRNQCVREAAIWRAMWDEMIGDGKEGKE